MNVATVVAGNRMCRLWAILAVFLISWAGAAAGSAGHAKQLQLKRADAAHFFARQLKFNHRLRVCNAYPYATMLTVVIKDLVLTDPPMAYRTCREFVPQLKSGDRIEFKFGDARAGTFVVRDLPQSDAVLMLVIYRHKIESTEVAFESHVFSNLVNAQLAVIDTYKGATQGSLRIQDLKDASTARSEELKYNSVVALNPGEYEVVLMGPDGGEKRKSSLVVTGGDSSVVIRCGAEPKNERLYPPELMVYPDRPLPAARSVAHEPRHSLSLILLVAALVASAVQVQ